MINIPKLLLACMEAVESDEPVPGLREYVPHDDVVLIMSVPLGFTEHIYPVQIQRLQMGGRDISRAQDVMVLFTRFIRFDTAKGRSLEFFPTNYNAFHAMDMRIYRQIEL
jgi:hypothetical protein